MHNYSWLVRSEIAGMGRPGRGFLAKPDAADDDLHKDLQLLKDEEVVAIISLTSEPVDAALAGEYDIEIVHLPVVDMAPPTLDQMHQFADFALPCIDGGGRVVVQCGAGLGRTGTFLACYLVARGMSAEEAIIEVRRKRPGSIESAGQEEVVHEFERACRERSAAGDEGSLAEP
jgi:atypical dual specificity phosphatase